MLLFLKKPETISNFFFPPISPIDKKKFPQNLWTKNFIFERFEQKTFTFIAVVRNKSVLLTSLWFLL